MSFHFSQVNAIGRKMKEMLLDREEQDLGIRGLLAIQKSKQTYEPLRIRAADVDFLRVEVFLEDIYELSGEVEISMEQLIAFEEALFKLMAYLDKTQKKKKRKVIEKIVAYMEAHYNESINLNTVAETFFMNASFLSKIFKEEMDIPFSKFVMEYRDNGSNCHTCV
ncbi:hypothetical protein GC098_23060 [Paenibacillus sp. LMG 31458]|uniref:HTH araC/xylS-type domain-containing protein n=1 Tax=Paenibacillus phytorum TaxID=2654977 RepID=A0ABX1Y1U7_9BACL|nr:hypothetical protein [Paenibacillus phytorum]NOU74241.1 hypothetical protein [Paenibacillus phytorum]